MSTGMLIAGLAGFWALAAGITGFFRFPSARERLAATLLVFCAAPGIADAFLAAARPGPLSPRVLLLGPWILAGGIWVALSIRRYRGTARRGERRRSPAFAAFTRAQRAHGGGADRILWPMIREIGRSGWRARIAGGGVAMVLALILCSAAHLPPRFADSILYHILHAIDWCQTGEVSFRLPADPRIDPWARAEGTPKAVECMAHYLMAYSGSIRPATLAQFPWLLLGLVSLAGLGRRVGLSTASQCLAAFVFLLTPEILHQSAELYCDVAMVSGVLCYLYFGTGLVWRNVVCSWVLEGGIGPEGGRPGSAISDGGRRLAASSFKRSVLRMRLVYGGVAVGAVLATKPTGLLLVPVLTFGIALVLALENRRDGETRGAGTAGRREGRNRLRRPRALSVIVSAVAGSLVIGGPWYIRNIADFSNPVYPYAIRVLGYEVFPGPQSFDLNREWLARRGLTAAQTWWRAWMDFDAGSGIAPRFGGFGPVPVVLGVPAVLAIVSASIVSLVCRRERASLRGRVSGRWIALIGLGLLVLAATPDPWWPRFALIVPALGALALSGLLAGVPFRVAGRWLLGVLLAAGLAWNLLRVIPALPGIMVSPQRWSLDVLAPRPSPLFVERDSASYTAMDYVREELSRSQARVLVVGSGVPGAFVPDDFGLATLDALSSEGLDGPRWIAELRRRGVTHVFFTWLYPGRPAEYGWTLERPEAFSRVFVSLTGGRTTPFDRERITWQELWELKPGENR